LWGKFGGIGAWGGGDNAHCLFQTPISWGENLPKDLTTKSRFPVVSSLVLSMKKKTFFFKSLSVGWHLPCLSLLLDWRSLLSDWLSLLSGRFFSICLVVSVYQICEPSIWLVLSLIQQVVSTYLTCCLSYLTGSFKGLAASLCYIA
jgi:hypothetical protein